MIALFFNPGFPSNEDRGWCNKYAKDLCMDVCALTSLSGTMQA